ncbi:hypothetical protein FQA39_LY04804 [Lamprigera yunnana]|nr:hypothetical protein FQA39_LY04804 [Lamprigera yunnana]
MATSLCKTNVLRLYRDVMEDVMHEVRELFLEDGVDEQVWLELKQAWETKLHANKAVHNPADHHVENKPEINIGPIAATHNNATVAGQWEDEQVIMKKPMGVTNGVNDFPKLQQPKQVICNQVPPNNHVQTCIARIPVETKLIPLQVTLPAPPGSDLGQRVLTIQVPASALQGNQLHKVLTGPVISATMNLPQALASSVLQQHVNAAFKSQQQPIKKPVMQFDGTLNESSSEDEMDCNQSGDSSQEINFKHFKNNINIEQIDGARDTSDEEDEASENDDVSDEVDEDKDEDEQDMDDTGPEEEPLNSEDDVTDEDPSDVFDTDNVIVCQYDKITRSRNKWKFHLKDGIMNLNGEDFVFQKANGDAEW